MSYDHRASAHDAPRGGATICPHGDLLEACLDCTVAPPRPEPRTIPKAVRTSRAMLSGRCVNWPRCQHMIERGDTIGLVPDVGWTCEECHS